MRGDKSKLFSEYVRVLKEVNPKYFIFENVASMPVSSRATITKILGVEPIMIDAALVSAQKRRRLFWTNLPKVQIPSDKGLLMKDVIDTNLVDKYITNMDLSKRRPYDYKVHQTPFDQKATALRAADCKGAHNLVKINNHFMRRISPIESERLQGLPDNYTSMLSDKQRYKCIGNAFNADVVAHIISYYK